MRAILSFLTVAGLLLWGITARAATQSSVTIGWSPSASSNIAGYMIYYGTSSGNYISAVPVSNVTNITINGLTSGTTYYFAATSLDSSGNQSGFSSEISATVGASGSVVITSQPASQSAALGRPATFAVAATGNSLAYQWNLNGNAISGATSPVLTISNVAANQAGSYSVNVTGNGGATTSTPAALTVYATAAASLATPAVPAGQFAVAVSGVPGYQYVVQASTDMKNWVSLQTNQAPFNFVDSNAGQYAQRFYRTEYLSNSSQ
ncbi:MAG TPA: fibronectin type III domain-containing protein [Verrucomicrobiae bacterium]|jgi:hypothetical protein